MMTESDEARRADFLIRLEGKAGGWRGQVWMERQYGVRDTDTGAGSAGGAGPDSAAMRDLIWDPGPGKARLR